MYGGAQYVLNHKWVVRTWKFQDRQISQTEVSEPIQTKSGVTFKLRLRRLLSLSLRLYVCFCQKTSGQIFSQICPQPPSTYHGWDWFIQIRIPCTYFTINNILKVNLDLYHFNSHCIAKHFDIKRTSVQAPCSVHTNTQKKWIKVRVPPVYYSPQSEVIKI